MARTRDTAARIAGAGGFTLVALALAGVVATLSGPRVKAQPVVPGDTVPGDTVPAIGAPGTGVPGGATQAPAPASPSHYPLDVGRYWVYRYREPRSDVVTEVERVIVRRQSRPGGADLFFFDDGSVVYFENGKVFEMGTSGGVNIIPVDVDRQPAPVVYRSQGLQIEKSFGAVDTAVVIDGQRFDGCLEVVTRFRALDADRPATGRLSYSSFYAPGVGLVARQGLSPDAAGSLTVTLADHGTRRL